MNHYLHSIWPLTVALVAPFFSADATAWPVDDSSESASSFWDVAQRTIDPIVSTEWLNDNLGTPGLVVLDVRPAADYEAEHIVSAISEPFDGPAWITVRDDLLLELPPVEELFDTVGNLGISSDSSVVVVSASNPGEPAAYGLANAARVADTLLYVGIRNVAILDGGHTKWISEGLPTTDEVPTVNPVTYSGEVREDMFVSTEYVESRIGRAVLLDTRDASVYFGATIEPFAPEPGHIPSARSLPAPWVWLEDGTYQDGEVLEAMAEGVVGWFKRREIIVYCGVGGYTSAWYFVLTEVLGYKNVKFYDGSAQEWVRTNGMVPYRWY